MIESDGVLTVIGAGQAGAELAVQAREAGWRGRIVLVGDEPALPYHRPPLSKAYLAGTATLDTLALKAHATYEQAGVELVLGRRVAAVDRLARRVEFDGGPSMAYSRLAFATGGRPRRLPAAAAGRRPRRQLPLPAHPRRCRPDPRAASSLAPAWPSSAAATSGSKWRRSRSSRDFMWSC